MSPVAIGLDLLLVALLLVALVVGWRLNRRLKALRDGQLGFIKAVAELDAAAARAEAGLKALREASDDVHDELLTRIETARGLIARLESANAAAAVHAPPAPAPKAMRAEAAVRKVEAGFERRLAAPARRSPPRSLDDDLFEDVVPDAASRDAEDLRPAAAEVLRRWGRRP